MFMLLREWERIAPSIRVADGVGDVFRKRTWGSGLPSSLPRSGVTVPQDQGPFNVLSAPGTMLRAVWVWALAIPRSSTRSVLKLQSSASELPSMPGGHC